MEPEVRNGDGLYAGREFTGKPALEMAPSDEAEKTAAAIAEAYERATQSWKAICWPRWPTMLYHWTGAPIGILRERSSGVTGVGRDITERKEGEQMLASETRVLEMMGSDAPLSAVLAEICPMIEGLSDGVLCSRPVAGGR